MDCCASNAVTTNTPAAAVEVMPFLRLAPTGEETKAGCKEDKTIRRCTKRLTAIPQHAVWF